MKKLFWCCAVLPLLACTSWGAQKPAPQTGSDPIQRFVVVRSIHFVAGIEAVTSAEANCSIETADGAASMECHPGRGVTAKNTYHYNAALIVDGKGMGYVIACRNSLIAFWCKEFGARTVIRGNLEAAKLGVADGDKVHDYAVLASKFVGLTAVTPALHVPAAPPADVAPVQPAAAPTSSAKRDKENPAALPSNSSAVCSSSTAACVSFYSDPVGADIYVDGKFTGNTPSILVLSPGSHEIRLEETDRKPWTRTLETSSGSNVTLRATFDASPGNK